MRVVLLPWVVYAVVAGVFVLAPASAWGQLAKQVFAKAARSVVVVVSSDAHGEATLQGSGVVVGSNEVVTNCHVIENAASVSVKQTADDAEGGETYKMSARVLVRDDERDLCLLFVDDLSAPPAAPMAAMGVAKELSIGEDVYAVGAPEGLELSLSRGVVSQLRQLYDGQTSPLVQTDAAISQGSSGGGLFDGNGKLVGITTFKWKGESLNFALPVEWVEDLQERGRMTTVGDLEHAQDLPDESRIGEAIQECHSPLEFKRVGQRCALTPRQRELVWALHHAMGLDLIKQALIVSSMMGFSASFNVLASEENVVVSEQDKAQFFSVVREHLRKEMEVNFADLIERRGRVFLSEYRETELPYFTDFVRSEFGGGAIRLTYKVQIEETEALLNQLDAQAIEALINSPEYEAQWSEQLIQRIMSRVKREFKEEEVSDNDIEIVNRFVAAAFPGVPEKDAFLMLRERNQKIMRRLTDVETEWADSLMSDEAVERFFAENWGN